MSSAVTCSRPSGRESRADRRPGCRSATGAGRQRPKQPAQRGQGAGHRLVDDRPRVGPRLAARRPRGRARAAGTRPRPERRRHADRRPTRAGRRRRRCPIAIIARSTSQALPPSSQPSSVADRAGRRAPREHARRTRPAAEVSMASGTNGTTSTFDERRHEREALEVDEDHRQGRELGGERQRHRLAEPGRPAGAADRSIRRPNQISPAVASSESWKPTSHSTDGATSSMSSAASPSADVACARRAAEPRRRASRPP